MCFPNDEIDQILTNFVKENESKTIDGEVIINMESKKIHLISTLKNVFLG